VTKLNPYTHVRYPKKAILEFLNTVLITTYMQTLPRLQLGVFLIANFVTTF